jgi:hypothetical protein
MNRIALEERLWVGVAVQFRHEVENTHETTANLPSRAAALAAADVVILAHFYRSEPVIVRSIDTLKALELAWQHAKTLEATVRG